MIPLPGHTAGHCGVAINTPDGWLLHCGDAFFFAGEIETPRRCPPGLRFFQTLNQHDGKARHRNQERLRELQRVHGGDVSSPLLPRPTDARTAPRCRPPRRS